MPRIGLIIRPEWPPERLSDLAAAVEADGLDDVWLWEDCFWSGGVAAVSAALAATSTVRVGLGLMPAPLRNPVLAAMEISGLARLYPGRFVPAAGHGGFFQQASGADFVARIPGQCGANGQEHDPHHCRQCGRVPGFGGLNSAGRRIPLGRDALLNQLRQGIEIFNRVAEIDEGATPQVVKS